MATTQTGTTTSSNPMWAGDVDARYRTGDDYWTERSGGPGPQVMAAYPSFPPASLNAVLAYST